MPVPPLAALVLPPLSKEVVDQISEDAAEEADGISEYQLRHGAAMAERRGVSYGAFGVTSTKPGSARVA